MEVQASVWLLKCKGSWDVNLGDSRRSQANYEGTQGEKVCRGLNTQLPSCLATPLIEIKPWVFQDSVVSSLLKVTKLYLSHQRVTLAFRSDKLTTTGSQSLRFIKVQVWAALGEFKRNRRQPQSILKSSLPRQHTLKCVATEKKYIYLSVVFN